MFGTTNKLLLALKTIIVGTRKKYSWHSKIILLTLKKIIVVIKTIIVGTKNKYFWH